MCSAHGSGLAAPSSPWLTAHGSRLTAPGSRLTPPGSRLTSHGSRLTAHSDRDQSLYIICIYLIYISIIYINNIYSEGICSESGVHSFYSKLLCAPRQPKATFMATPGSPKWSKGCPKAPKGTPKSAQRNKMESKDT